jgi:hypothetical protein
MKWRETYENRWYSVSLLAKIEVGLRRSGWTSRDKTFQSSSYLALVSGINDSAEGLYFRLSKLVSYMNIRQFTSELVPPERSMDIDKVNIIFRNHLYPSSEVIKR